MVEGAVWGTVHVLEAALAQGVERLVQLGSFLEYGPSPAPVPESAAPRPVTLRGAAKAAATLWSQGFARATGLGSVVLRVFSAYGPWEQPGRLVPSAVRAALDGRPLPVTPSPSWRDFVYVDDVVSACLLAADARVAPGEAINVGSGVLSSSADVIAAVEAACARRLRIEGHYPAAPADASACAADLAKACAVLGWRPRHSLAQGIEATVAWLRERQERLGPVEPGRLVAGGGPWPARS
jgi:nucleoside-diphosphate-sugar epimerase